MDPGPLSLKNRHSHDFPELFWVEEGRGVHLVGGVQRKIDSGMLIFVRAEEIHTIGAAEAGGAFRICNLAFPAQAWEFFRRRYLEKGDDWFRVGKPERREWRADASLFGFLLRSGPELAAAPRSRLVLERFLLNLAFAHRGGEKEPAPGMPAWLRESAGRVEREGRFREGAPALARAAGRSAEHVARETRRLTGKTPTGWVNEMRMRHAARLLGGTQREILDVCGECGFENVSHFYALFRAHHGMTPLHYRRRSGGIVRLDG
jgi:AraC family cel operon transcriptional repressor